MPDEKSEPKIARARAAKPFIKPSVGEWRNISEGRAVELARAYSNEIRRMILALLDRYGPMRKYMVTRLLNRELRMRGEEARYQDVTVHHHLKILEKAGLVGSMPGEGKRSKIIYRAGDIQIRWRARRRPRKPFELPEREEEFFKGTT